MLALKDGILVAVTFCHGLVTDNNTDDETLGFHRRNVNNQQMDGNNI